jgi:hypothetical protein
MRYFDWNIAIGNYFFNCEKAEKNVHLFIFPSEIGEIGINRFGFASEEDAIMDYYNALSVGYAGFEKTNSIIKKAEILFALWNKNKAGIFKRQRKWSKIDIQIDSSYITDQTTQITYPFYLAMLTILIMPLTGYDEDFRANAYYPRLNKFLRDIGLDNNIGAADFGIIDKLWDDLSSWSTTIYKTDIGIFSVGHFGNRNWIHVGKVFAQCVLTPSDIKNLPKLFSLAGFMPDTNVPTGIMKNALLKNGLEIGLSKNALKILKDGDSDLQSVIINIAKGEHYKWKGNIERKQGEKIDEKEAWVHARLFSSFTIDKINEEFKHYYFVYSSNDFPDNLTYNNSPVKLLYNGFSYPIRAEFNPSLAFQDKYNKWKSMPVLDDIILYRHNVNGVSNDYWIQTDKLYPTSKMYLLCNDLKKESIIQWSNFAFSNGNFKEADLDGIPQGYTLYSISNPQEGHPDEPTLRLQTHLEIQFVGGLKVKNRVFLNYYLPKIRIEGIGEPVKVYAELVQTNIRIYLLKSVLVGEEWSFPDNMPLDEDFIIKVEGLEALETYPHRIVSCCVEIIGMEDNNHPKRDGYDEITQSVSESYVIGNNVQMPNLSQQAGDLHEFWGSQQVSLPYSQDQFDYNHSKGNVLLYYLSFIVRCNTQAFGFAFDTVFASENMFNILKKSNLRTIKRYALIYLDYLGYIDFDYVHQKIVINKPQLMLIPDKTEIRACLTGARSNEFVDKLFEYAKQESINISIIKQDDFFESYLIPDTIFLTPKNCQHVTAGLIVLENLARRFGIYFYFIEKPYRQPKIIQWGLRNFSADLSRYRNNMYKKRRTEETDYPYKRDVFSTNTLKFERSEENASLDKELSLVQYNIHYDWLYRFWNGSICYDVDRSWGQFLLLSECKKDVIYYDEEHRIVVSPSHVHLPKFIAKSLILLSGRIPSFQNLHINGNCISYQLYENVPKTFAENLFKKLDQSVQSYKFRIK